MKHASACALLAFLPLASPAPSTAHPSLFVDAGARLTIAEDATLKTVEIEWIFDKTYSIYLVETMELDRDGDGRLAEDERNEVIGMHMDGLDEFGWFTYLAHLGEAVPLEAAQEKFDAALTEGRVALRFTLTPAAAVDVSTGPATLKLYDPSFLVGMIVSPGALSLEAPARCSMESPAGTGAYLPELMLSLNVTAAEGATLAEKLAPPIAVKCE